MKKCTLCGNTTNYMYGQRYHPKKFDMISKKEILCSVCARERRSQIEKR